VISWGELPVLAAWLVLGAVLTWILAGRTVAAAPLITLSKDSALPSTPVM
jgi:hypothetical protein